MNINLQTPVGEIARFNYKTVEVFENSGLIFAVVEMFRLKKLAKGKE